MKTLDCLDQPCCAPGAPPLAKPAARALADRFKALSDPARVSIVNRVAGSGEVCTCQLIEPLGLSQPTVSHHLRVLKEAGLVEVARRRGTWTFYRLVPEAVEELAFALGTPQLAGAS
ncbi:MAG TPA: metalloregulator ArsR/SmtB family transcription factor [Gaiellaceae bacterium]|jgi:ArsR family transcriptional regulator|nr:metalloregulator ArsR/SmtB family transcription factor [Gaiellaceae bacterium]